MGKGFVWCVRNMEILQGVINISSSPWLLSVPHSDSMSGAVNQRLNGKKKNDSLDAPFGERNMDQFSQRSLTFCVCMGVACSDVSRRRLRPQAFEREISVSLHWLLITNAGAFAGQNESC